MLFFALLAICLAAVAWLSLRLRLTEDISKVLPRNEQVDQYLEVVNRSAFADELVIFIGPADPSDPPAAGALMDFASALADSVRASLIPEYVSGIRERTENDAIRQIYREIQDHLPIYLNETDFSMMDALVSDSAIHASVGNAYKNLASPMGFMSRDFILADPLGLTGIAMKKLESFNIDESYRVIDGYVFSRDERYLLMFLSPAEKSTETAKNEIMLERLDRWMAQISADSGGAVKAGYFGSVAISVANARQLQRDIMLTMSLAIVLLVLFIGFYFGKFRVIPAIVLTTLMSAGLSIAILKLAGKEVSAVSLGFGAVLLGIAIAYTIHYLNHLREVRNPRQVIREIATPIVMSAVISSGDFFTLLLVRSDAVRDLGLFAGFSILAAGLFTLIVLPHITRKINWERSRENLVNRTVHRIAAFPVENVKWLPPAIILITIVLLFASRKVGFESDMTGMSHMTRELRNAEATLDSISQYSLRSVFVVTRGKDPGDALENTSRLIEKVEDLKEQGLVKKYLDITELAVPPSLQTERIHRWNEYWTPERREQVISKLNTTARSAGFREGAFDEFAEWLNETAGAQYYVGAKNIAPLQAPYLSQSPEMATVTTVLKVRQDDKPALYQALGEMPDSFVFDKQYLTSAFMDILNQDFNKLVIVSLLIVFLVLLISYGRIELTLITFIPMLISWIWTLGIMGLLGIKLNIFNIIITSFVFGLGIDYALFSIQGLLQQYQYGKGDVNAYRSSVLMDAVTTLIGLGVLILAVHPALRSMASAAIIGIVSVWFVTWSLEPVLFRWLVYVKDRKRPVPVTLKDFLFAILSLSIFVTGSILLMIYGLIVFKLLRVKKGPLKDGFHWGLMISSRFLIYANFLSPKKLINWDLEDLKKPAVLIANHQSHIDIALMLMLHPRLLELTNDRVQGSRLYGPLVRMAEFYPVSAGTESLLENLRKNVDEGYSVLIFPEGTRSPDTRIQRFHKGAFLLAQELGIDLLPVIIHGSGPIYTKGEYFLKVGQATIRFLPRIRPDDLRFGVDLLEKSRNIRKYMAEEYRKVAEEAETPEYFREKLVKNYMYKGPVLEWYMKIKTRLENNYALFDRHLPKEGQITDIGCGYGFMAYMLSFLSGRRTITGIDYDGDKIDTANHCPAKSDRVRFIHADVLQAEILRSHAFILADVLHYFPEADQERLVVRCIEKLEPGGTIIIRDADRAMEKKHFGTRLSESFSTRIGFNQTRNNEKKLYFTSREKILKILNEHGMQVEIIDETKMTSNLVYIARKA